MDRKKSLGQFYTKNSEYILKDLIKEIPESDIIIDPFSGEWDLLRLFKNKKIAYDIDPKNNDTIKNDSLLNPKNYSDSWIITNPPYLARNKNKDKTIYDKYQTDDLYKCSLKTFSSAKGGIVIIPVNFFCSEDDSIRNYFLSQFRVNKVYVYEEQVFEDTTNSVCAFHFKKEENIETQNIEFIFFPSGEIENFELKKEEGFRVGYEIYNLPYKVLPKRLMQGQSPNSNIFCFCVDGKNDNKIHLSLKEPFYGISTDRAFATLIFDKEYPLHIQEEIVQEFNKRIKYYREKYHSLFLTTYREESRKRIGFDLLYRIIGNILLTKNFFYDKIE